jgi:hypothetical protein
MDCDGLRDAQWERIKGFGPIGTKGKRTRTDNRMAPDALFWLARSGGRGRAQLEKSVCRHLSCYTVGE